MAPIQGTISRLVDHKQIGAISGDDGRDYEFSSASLIGARFDTLALGTKVTFTPTGTANTRASDVRIVK